MSTEYVALTDQLNGKVRLVRMDAPGWDEAEWEWSPKPEDGCFDWEKFINVSDVRLRKSEKYGGYVMLTCASLGFAGIIGYPSGKPVWTLKNSDLINPHATELLPNGNLCVASSEGNSVRVYAASQEMDCGYAEAFFEDAHGLLYDPEREVVWALGKHFLTAYRVGGTDADPTLTEAEEFRTPLPTPYGHDLQPVYGDPRRMWITTGKGVYQFDKTTLQWVDYEGQAQISHPYVKSIGNQPGSGDVVRCLPNGTQQPWNTDRVDLFRFGEKGYRHQLKICQNGAFYKARVWCEKYL